MKFEINQIIEVVDGKPVILSSDIRLLTPSADLYSLARDYIEEYNDYEFVQRNQYSGYRINHNKRRRYTIVLIPQQDRLIICSAVKTDTESKLFPYLWETVITSVLLNYPLDLVKEWLQFQDVDRPSLLPESKVNELIKSMSLAWASDKCEHPNHAEYSYQKQVIEAVANGADELTAIKAWMQQLQTLKAGAV